MVVCGSVRQSGAIELSGSSKLSWPMLSLQKIGRDEYPAEFIGCDPQFYIEGIVKLFARFGKWF